MVLQKVQVPGGTSISWQMVANKANEEAAITYTTTTKPTPTKTITAIEIGMVRERMRRKKG